MDLVFLHGGVAAGKLTVARALSTRLGYPVFHNHLVVDLLTGVFPFGSEPFVRLREEFWLSVFSEAAAAGTSLIFTFAPESTVAAGFPERTRRAVEDHGGAVRFVRLGVGAAEQERRLGDPSRREFHKLTDVETLHRLRRGQPLVELPPAELDIDTDSTPPADAAARIVEHFALTRQQPVRRYPD